MSIFTFPSISVIDFCLVKCQVCDEETNFQSLRLQWSSKASSTQRKGLFPTLINCAIRYFVFLYVKLTLTFDKTNWESNNNGLFNPPLFVYFWATPSHIIILVSTLLRTCTVFVTSRVVNLPVFFAVHICRSSRSCFPWNMLQNSTKRFLWRIHPWIWYSRNAGQCTINTGAGDIFAYCNLP